MYNIKFCSLGTSQKYRFSELSKWAVILNTQCQSADLWPASSDHVKKISWTTSQKIKYQQLRLLTTNAVVLDACTCWLHQHNRPLAPLHVGSQPFFAAILSCRFHVSHQRLQWSNLTPYNAKLENVTIETPLVPLSPLAPAAWTRTHNITHTYSLLSATRPQLVPLHASLELLRVTWWGLHETDGAHHFMEEWEHVFTLQNVRALWIWHKPCSFKS